MRILLTVLVIGLLQACAFTDVTLDVKHESERSYQGPIGDIESVAIASIELDDARDDIQRVGWKKNGYGQNTADILSARTVNEVVEEGLVDGFAKNGHQVADSGDIKVRGTVNRFWFEFDPNFWTVEFIGDVQCTLEFLDATTDTLIYSSDYSGNYSVKTGGGGKNTWTNVMNKALSNMIENVMYDEELTEALEDR